MLKEYKSVTEVVGPLMVVQGVEGVKYEELVDIELQDETQRLPESRFWSAAHQDHNLPDFVNSS